MYGLRGAMACEALSASTSDAELDIHLPLTDKSHERDGEQQDQRKEKRTRQGRIGVHQIFLSDIIAARQFVHATSLEKRLR